MTDTTTTPNTATNTTADTASDTTTAKTTEVKTLPDLSSIETQDWFKKAYDSYKTDEYRKMLDDMGVGYLASDTKTALTYRYLDAKGELVNADTATPVTDTKADTKADSKTDTTTETTAEPKIVTAPAQTVKDNSVKTPAPVTAPTPTTTPTTTTPAKADDGIWVDSKLPQDMFEPATGTRLIAGKKTKVTPTARVSRERIISNLTQLAKLNGSKLTFGE